MTGQMPAFAAAAPEILLAIAGMGLLLYGAFRGNGATREIAYLVIASYIAAAALVVFVVEVPTVTFSGLFVADGFGAFAKVLVLLGSALGLLISLDYIEREQMARFEYPVLFLFATLGMMVMISAGDLITLYLGLELQSLSLYVIAAFRRDMVRSAEAGLKYFVLGALSSGMLLYGASLVYGFTGTTSFAGLAATLSAEAPVSIGLVVGIVFVSAGLAFKVSAVPFHMWTPDVYEGAPTPVTAFFAVAPKIAAIALFIRVMVGPFGELVAQWQQIVFAVSILSMLLGALAAIWQTNIKRLMAYSSIGHIGYALIGLATGTEEGVRGILVYMAIYLAMNVGTFACILCMRVNGRMVEGIDDLRGLSRTNPMIALALAIFMFSMAGIPPLAGFFGKLYVFLAAINSGLYVLAVIGVLTSVIGAYYYLRIVKLMYFDDPVEGFDQPIDRGLSVVLAGTGLFTLFFFAFPPALVNRAAAAAATLFGG